MTAVLQALPAPGESPSADWSRLHRSAPGTETPTLFSAKPPVLFPGGTADHEYELLLHARNMCIWRLCFASRLICRNGAEILFFFFSRLASSLADSSIPAAVP
jgi:hypothetical protein